MGKLRYILLVPAIFLLLMGFILLAGDFTSFLQWWGLVLLIGIIFMPLTNLVFSGFHDKGYLFSKTIGIAITGYLMWLLSSMRIMKFTPAGCIISLGIGLLVNLTVLTVKNYSKRGNPIITEATPGKNYTLDYILIEELLFLALFLLFTYIRGFKPEAYGTEKFMDYGFMTSMMRSENMPPQDFWFSGTKLNYYYVGQYMATFLTKLSFVKVSLGYNLALMMVGAFAFVLPYSLVTNVVLRLLQDREKKGIPLIHHVCGLIGGTAVCIAGNMHYPIYQWLEPAVRKFFGMEASTDKYWFPDATRFIGYHPETTDKTIHEFPAYSFVLGDLHAHVINIMFVLTVLGILFAWMCKRRDNQSSKVTLWQEVFHPAMFFLAFFIGLFHTTNFWDFPIYYVVSGAVILFTNILVYNFKGKLLWVTALQGMFILVVSKVVCLPFTLNFDQISTNIRLAVAHTPLNQLIILWGLPIFTVIMFLCFVLSDYGVKRRTTMEPETRKQKAAIVHFFETLSAADLFIILLGLCAIGLILIPELIYVEDIYSGDYKRANTMFKLTYQAFILFGICFGYILLRLIIFGRTKRQRGMAIFSMLLLISSVFYIQNAVNSWYGNIFLPFGYKGLDATAFMENTMPDDVPAIRWLNENVSGTPVVLEANGDSYTDYQRVSVMTGLPTVLGWRTHEWLWKSDPSLLDLRAEDIAKIYTSTDKGEINELLEKYDISYIYVGKLEVEKFPAINHTMLKELGELVYTLPAEEASSFETYIVKIQ